MSQIILEKKYMKNGNKLADTYHKDESEIPYDMRMSMINSVIIYTC